MLRKGNTPKIYTKQDSGLHVYYHLSLQLRLRPPKSNVHPAKVKTYKTYYHVTVHLSEERHLTQRLVSYVCPAMQCCGRYSFYDWCAAVTHRVILEVVLREDRKYIGNRLREWRVYLCNHDHQWCVILPIVTILWAFVCFSGHSVSFLQWVWSRDF